MTTTLDDRGNLLASRTCGPGEIENMTDEQQAEFREGIQLVVNMCAVHPDFRCLVESSLLLLKVLSEGKAILEAILKALEDNGADEEANAIIQHLAAYDLAQRCAVEGQKILSEHLK